MSFDPLRGELDIVQRNGLQEITLEYMVGSSMYCTIDASRQNKLLWEMPPTIVY